MEARGLSAHWIGKQTGLSARVVRRITSGVDVRAGHWLELVWILGCPWEELRAVLPPPPELPRRERPLNETEEKILVLLRLHRGRLQGSTASGIAEQIGKSPRQIRRALRSLEEERGLIRKERDGRCYTFLLLDRSRRGKGR
jgi:uncharacterized membrane protein